MKYSPLSKAWGVSLAWAAAPWVFGAFLHFHRLEHADPLLVFAPLAFVCFLPAVLMEKLGVPLSALGSVVASSAFNLIVGFLLVFFWFKLADVAPPGPPALDGGKSAGTAPPPMPASVPPSGEPPQRPTQG